MKLCLILGDLQADRMDDVYPTDNVCEECLISNSKKGKLNLIIDILGECDSNFGDSCHFCGKSYEQDAIENG